MTDAELVARAANGDTPSFALLYERHWRAVYNYAWLLARSVPDAEDVTQECFLALARRPKSFDPERAQLRTWLLAVARNQALQRVGSRAHEALQPESDLADVGPGVEQELMRLERAAAVRRAFAALPLAQREALYLFEFEALSLVEVATILGIAPNAVKARVFRGRESLKRLLGPLRPALSLKGEDV